MTKMSSLGLDPKGKIKEGYLIKSPPLKPLLGFEKRWHQRWFVLYDPNLASVQNVLFPAAEGKCLVYFKTPGERKWIDKITLRPGTRVEDRKSSVVGFEHHQHVIDLVTKDRLFHLCASDEADKNEWYRVLKLHIDGEDVSCDREDSAIIDDCGDGSRKRHVPPSNLVSSDTSIFVASGGQTDMVPKSGADNSRRRPVIEYCPKPEDPGRTECLPRASDPPTETDSTNPYVNEVFSSEGLPQEINLPPNADVVEYVNIEAGDPSLPPVPLFSARNPVQWQPLRSSKVIVCPHLPDKKSRGLEVSEFSSGEVSNASSHLDSEHYKKVLRTFQPTENEDEDKEHIPDNKGNFEKRHGKQSPVRGADIHDKYASGENEGTTPAIIFSSATPRTEAVQESDGGTDVMCDFPYEERPSLALRCEAPSERQNPAPPPPLPPPPLPQGRSCPSYGSLLPDNFCAELHVEITRTTGRDSSSLPNRTRQRRPSLETIRINCIYAINTNEVSYTRSSKPTRRQCSGSDLYTEYAESRSPTDAGDASDYEGRRRTHSDVTNEASYVNASVYEVRKHK